MVGHCVCACGMHSRNGCNSRCDCRDSCNSSRNGCNSSGCNGDSRNGGSRGCGGRSRRNCESAAATATSAMAAACSTRMGSSSCNGCTTQQPKCASDLCNRGERNKTFLRERQQQQVQQQFLRQRWPQSGRYSGSNNAIAIIPAAAIATDATVKITRATAATAAAARAAAATISSATASDATAPRRAIHTGQGPRRPRQERRVERACNSAAPRHPQGAGLTYGPGKAGP